MHDIKWIREHEEEFDRGLARRGLPPEAGKLIALDERRRAAIQKVEAALARRNAASKEIGAAKKSNEEGAAQALMAEVARLKSEIPALEAEEKQLSRQLDEALAQIPNLPLDEVPDGKDESANVEHHHFGAKRNYGFAPKQHFDLGEALGQMDFATAAKLSGARFVVLKSGLARLERALGQFMLDLHTTEHGYTEVNPPLLVHDETMFGTAQLPKFADDQFFATRTIARAELLRDALKYARSEDQEEFRQGKIDLESLVDRTVERAPVKEDFWLIPTAEVPLTNLVRESILDDTVLPMRFTACTPCFRAEAGAAPARPALPRGDAVHRRHGLSLAEDLRHRGLAARAKHVPGDFVVLCVRRIPGAAYECALPRQGRPPGAARAYAQRFGRRRRPRARRCHGDLSAAGRFDRGAGCAAAVYGWHQDNRAAGMTGGAVRASKRSGRDRLFSMICPLSSVA